MSMNFRDTIERVLNKMVVPKYDFIEHVVYKSYGSKGDTRFYEIIYIVKDGLFYKVDRNVMSEIFNFTHDLICMIGLKDHEDYSVHFSNGMRKYLPKG